MSDFEEKLNAILGNADAMSQVMQLAQSLNLGGSPPEEDGSAPAPSPTPPPSPPAGGGLDLGGLGNLGNLADMMGQIDPKMIQRLLPLVGELTGGGGMADQRLQLLQALRPFLKPERRDKVDRALQAAKLLHVGKKFLSTMGDSNV